MKRCVCGVNLSMFMHVLLVVVTVYRYLLVEKY